MKGLILSGGRGTRLRPITHTSAKQLIPIANKPILFYAIEALVAAGITEIGIITGETGAEVRAAVGEGSAFGARCTFLPQKEPKGLADALLTARDYLGDSSFVMYLGDNLVRHGIVPVVKEFERLSPDAMILLAQVSEPQHFGVAEVVDGQVVGLVEKPAAPKSDLALVGVYLFTPAIFEAASSIEYSARGELEITDAIQRLIDTGGRVVPHLITTRHEASVATWKDTGRLEDLLEANCIVLDDMEPRPPGGVVGSDVHLEGNVIVEAAPSSATAPSGGHPSWVGGRSSRTHRSARTPRSTTVARCAVPRSSTRSSLRALGLRTSGARSRPRSLARVAWSVRPRSGRASTNSCSATIPRWSWAEDDRLAFPGAPAGRPRRAMRRLPCGAHPFAGAGG